MGSCYPVAAPEEGPQTAHREAAVQARGQLTEGERFPGSARLARPADIRRCFAEGRRRRTAHLEMVWSDNAVGHPRLGLVVPRFQATAVARNRLRRRLKEVWRREVHSRQPSWDLLIRARREAYAASFPELREELLAWRDAVCPGA